MDELCEDWAVLCLCLDGIAYSGQVAHVAPTEATLGPLRHRRLVGSVGLDDALQQATVQKQLQKNNVGALGMQSKRIQNESQAFRQFKAQPVPKKQLS